MPHGPRQPGHKTLNIEVGPGWVEIPRNRSEGHAWHKEPDPVGILRVSIHPPQWDDPPPKGLMEGRLLQLIHSLKMPVGRLQMSACDDFALGPAAWCQFNTPNVGLVTYCLIASELAVFSTFEQTGGTALQYEEQMLEALAILQRSELESVSDQGRAADAPLS